MSLTEYYEEVDVRNSVRKHRLCLKKRFYSEDFFGASIPALYVLFWLFFAVRGRNLTWNSGLVCALLLALSAAGIYSISNSYRLIAIPGHPRQECNRGFAVSALQALGWEIGRNTQQYLSGFSRAGAVSGYVIVVIHGESQIWVNCRSVAHGRFGRLPFCGRLATARIAAFRSQFMSQLNPPPGQSLEGTAGRGDVQN